MQEPIKAGNLAEVVSGMQGTDSPNIGLIVKVIKYVGDEITLGRIWRCEAEYAQRIQERPSIPNRYVDFAQSWLRKINPPPLPTKQKELETT